MPDFVCLADGVVSHDGTFPLLNRGYQTDILNERQWFEITEETFDYFLTVLPPKHFLGHAFEMSEAATHRLSHAYTRIGARHFCLVVVRGDQAGFNRQISAFKTHIRDHTCNGVAQ